jgi:metallo-beta-lactamase family protein
LLVKRGFSGEFITTSASCELVKLVLLDSAHIQEDEACYKTKKALRKGNIKKDIEPLYNTFDVLNSFIFFGRTALYNRLLDITRDIQVTFIDAGHILGSASIVLSVKHNAQPRKIFFWRFRLLRPCHY